MLRRSLIACPPRCLTEGASSRLPLREESDLTRVMASWCWEQCDRAQHWSVFKDPKKVSSPKSFKEFAHHLLSNLDAFRFNYSTLPFKSLNNWTLVLANRGGVAGLCHVQASI
ncbi:hypothetical protein MRX96_015791 [Rhipicephalus microplus]